MVSQINSKSRAALLNSGTSTPSNGSVPSTPNSEEQAPSRRRILSSSSFKTMLLSVSSSGTSTPRGMEKTDSVINLTKPSLYGIYNDNSVLNLNRDDEDGNDLPPQGEPQPEEKPQEEAAAQLSVFTGLALILKIIILTGSAYVYNEVTDHVHANHISVNNQTMEPIIFTQWFLYDFVRRLSPLNYLVKTADSPQTLEVTDRIVSLAIQGLIMSAVHPIMDYILPTVLTKRLLSSNPNPLNNATLTNDLLRALITFLGISYAIRKIEWNSTLQISIIWSLLNPGLWLLLDGTISGFLSSLSSAFIACITIYFQNVDIINRILASDNGWEKSVGIWLWVGSFFFCGLILFGKLGRALFPVYKH